MSNAIEIFFIGVSYLLFLCAFPLSLLLCLKIVAEYERAVIFRMGRLKSREARGPGLYFILPCIDEYIKVDLRTASFDIPSQDVLTRDSVTITVNAVVYHSIENPLNTVLKVANYSVSTQLLAATILRDVLGIKTLSEILADRESMAETIRNNLAEATIPWGVRVERVEIKDVSLPTQMQRSMAAEAEATREARAKVVAADGELKSSRALKEAAEVISQSPAALQLRYLQTLDIISAEKNSTIIFPLPMDILGPLIKK